MTEDREIRRRALPGQRGGRGAGTERRETRVQKRRRTIYTGTAVLLIAFLALFDVCNLIHRDKTYSENENRMLAQKPEWSLESLASGKFMTDMESYVTDQFILRDGWIRVKYLMDQLTGKRESNGVYLGKDGYLLGIPGEPKEEQVTKTLQAICDFADRNEDLKIVMTLVPNAAAVCDQYLPSNAPVRDQRKDIARVENVVDGYVDFRDITDALKAHKTEEIYYRTDHHWTSLGAKYAYEALEKPLGIGAAGEQFDIYPVSDSFAGTLASKVGYHKKKDVVELYVSRNGNPDYVVDYVGEKKNASIYCSEALDQKDKYEVFFGGNHARVEIRTQNSGENLLLLKDSYANCFVQFLLPYYKSITIIDPRYYYNDIDRLILSNGITEVLILYNVDTFMSDTSLADVIEG